MFLYLATGTQFRRTLLDLLYAGCGRPRSPPPAGSSPSVAAEPGTTALLRLGTAAGTSPAASARKLSDNQRHRLNETGVDLLQQLRGASG